MLVYCNLSALFMARSDGTEVRQLASVPGRLYAPQISPHQRRIRFSVEDTKNGGRSIWEASMQGKNPHPLLPGLHDPPDEQHGRWTSDGRYFIFESGGQIWALPEKTGFFRQSIGTPVKLTDSPLNLDSPLPSKDGKKLFITGQRALGELVRYDGKSGEFLPFLSGISAEHVAFSKDGQWVAYVTYPDGILWRSKADGSERVKLTGPPFYALHPRWSPDGKQIVFYSWAFGGQQQSFLSSSSPPKPYKIYVVPRDGGSPESPIHDLPGPQTDANWSPDGSKIVFAGGIDDKTSAIHILDLASHQISDLPDSQGYYSPRWSPDGRYIAALPLDTLSIVLFDFQTHKWSELTRTPVGFPNWSADGKYIYFLRSRENPAVLRVRIRDRKVEEVADLKGLPTTGFWGISLALTPDDSPLLLRNLGTQDIYALDFEAP
jgi:Tol biopolymer transport system component